MEGKTSKEIKATWPFPLLRYDAKVRYSEVRKASGIAFILLDLIQKVGSRQERLSDQLLLFGIPADLHDIFGRELARLKAEDIIDCSVNARYLTNPLYFAELKLSDFSLTEKGIKLFKDGYLPTGEEKAVSKKIFFAPFDRKFRLVEPTPSKPVEETFAGDGLYDLSEIDVSGLEDYVEANKRDFGLKEEEAVVGLSFEQPSKLAVYKGMTIKISDSSLSFSFSSTNERDYFDKHCGPKLVEKGIKDREDFKFPVFGGTPIVAEKADASALSHCLALHLPGQLKQIAASPSQVYLGKAGAGDLGDAAALRPGDSLSSAILKTFDPNALFAIIGEEGCHYFCPYEVSLFCPQLDEAISLPLLLEYKADAVKFKGALDQLFAYCLNRPFGQEAGRFVAFAVKSTGDVTYFEKTVEHCLSPLVSIDDKASELMRIDAIFGQNQGWKECFVPRAKVLFGESASEITLGNLAYKNAILSPLRKAIGLSEAEYVAKVALSLENEDQPAIWEAMESAGFDPAKMLGAVNIVPTLMESVLKGVDIDSKSAFASPFKTVAHNMAKLNAMLGIDNPDSYTIGENYNAEEFLNVYGTFMKAYRAIAEYRDYAPSQFSGLERLASIYGGVQNELSIEKASASDPDRIDAKYIDGLLDRGKYKEAVCDLFVKAQFELRKALHEEGRTPACELIKSAVSKRLLTKSQASLLNELRICRNGFQHPESNPAACDKAAIEKWAEAVFLLTEGKR